SYDTSSQSLFETIRKPSHKKLSENVSVLKPRCAPIKRKPCFECESQRAAMNDLEKSIDRFCELASDIDNTKYDEKTMTDADYIKQMLSQLTPSQFHKRVKEELSQIKLFEAPPPKRCKTEVLIVESIGDEIKVQKSCRNCVKQSTLDNVKKSVDKLCEILNKPHDDRNRFEKLEMSHLSAEDFNTFVLLCMNKLYL
ncbi:3766_t:CDS:2, partial [Paraglomus occultum]